MASGDRIYSNSSLPPIIQHHHHTRYHQPPLNSSFYLSGSSTSILGSSSMVSFEDANTNNNSSKNKRSFFQSFEQEDNGDDQDYDEYFNQSGKKGRLTLNQLNFLEKSFEMDNKLEPDRKLQLAKDLGLQPRQVAIWFQNRRARWKTKQMEKDYDVLQESFIALKANYDSLFQEKENLKSQIALLSEEYALKQKGKDMLDAMSSEPYQAMQENPAAASISDSDESKVSAIASKQAEYSTSPKMDNNGIFDSDSTSTKKDNIFETGSRYYINGGSMHSPHMEHVDSSYMLEPDNSDLSQDEDERGSFLLSTPYRLLPKLEPGDYLFASSSTSGNFGFPVEDNAFWSWSF